ncbi:MAG: hypothetical protein M0D54_10895 [Hyphomonadaceae bacterium JAD_PAG50586_4]|nr:MAG: hypothetical protein M0D54_10895 [Hyphomonadaceae bacterium JAD_PAG50586_4]
MKARLTKQRLRAIGPGPYVDYRGVAVEVLHVGQDAGSAADVVIYRVLGNGAVLVEPLSEFAGIVQAFGERYWRFTALREPNLFFDIEEERAV